MKIDALSPLRSRPIRSRNRVRSAGPISFASELAEEVSESRSMTGAGTVAPVDALLALQEVADPPTGHEQAKRRGEEILAQLDALRHALLVGALPLAGLERLARTLEAGRGDIADPRLTEVIEEIELRAAVELAKLGR